MAGVLALPLACVLGAASWLLVPLVRGTVEAGRGGETPAAAVNGYVLTYGEWTGRDDTIGVNRWLSANNRDHLTAQRLDIIDTMRRVEKNNDTTIQLKMTEPPTVTMNGNDHATVTHGIRFDFRPDSTTTLIYQGHTEPWTFRTVKERTGWKVEEVQHPPLCGAHFKPESC
jgi:hypothetical protein